MKFILNRQQSKDFFYHVTICVRHVTASVHIYLDCLFSRFIKCV